MKVLGRYIAVVALGIVGLAGVSYLVVPPRADAQALTAEDRARLQAEYDQLQKEIAEWQKILDETRSKKNTLQGDVTLLNAQIKKAETEIRQRNTVITRLGSEINEKTKHIQTLEQRLEDGRESMAKLLREKYKIETTPLALVALSPDGLSDFFKTVDAIDVINEDLQAEFEELISVRDATTREKLILNERQNQELDAKYEVEVKKKQISQDEAEKKKLLTITAQEEKSYQEVLSERQRRAEAIRTALFELRDTQGISFARALEYASNAEAKTGVRAAFILGILRQESNLGANVGTCVITDLTSGETRHVSSGKVYSNGIHPTRDLPYLQVVVKELGRDPLATRVSCPQSIGYGGAMGPSQFIPSTWKSYQSKIAAAVGVSLPDPWNPQHAIMATALFLRDLGAAKQTYSAEREAAARYYAGASWARNGLGYAGSVLSFATKYQEDIDFLKDN